MLFSSPRRQLLCVALESAGGGLRARALLHSQRPRPGRLERPFLRPDPHLARHPAGMPGLSSRDEGKRTHGNPGRTVGRLNFAAGGPANDEGSRRCNGFSPRSDAGSLWFPSTQMLRGRPREHLCMAADRRRPRLPTPTCRPLVPHSPTGPLAFQQWTSGTCRSTSLSPSPNS